MPYPAEAHRHPGAIPLEALQSLDSMEGVYAEPVAEIQPPEALPDKPALLPGYVLALSVTALSYLIHYLPLAPFRVVSESGGVRYPISATTIAILAGMAVRNLIRVPGSLIDSARGLPRKVIPPSIVLTGAGLNLAAIATVGTRAILITLACIVAATAAALWLGMLTRLWRKTAILIGAGTAICGTSAIIAVAPLIEAEDQDMLLSIGTVNILGIIFMFGMPVVASSLKLSDQAFGVWAGTSIHAVPQVVAAAFSYSQPAGALATLVKLFRVALLAPFMFILGIWHARRFGAGQARIHYGRLMPPFVWGFLFLAVLNTANLLPILQFPFGRFQTAVVLTNVGELLLAISMAAMGFEVDLVHLSKVGGRAFLVGSLAGVVLCGTSLLLIRILL
jgi:uncharacterized integral membrane protein (TIGR00698 family)